VLLTEDGVETGVDVPDDVVRRVAGAMLVSEVAA
jgi:hypothetical protein